MFDSGVPEGGPVEGGQHVLAGNAVLARHGLDIAVVATGAESQFLEDRYGLPDATASRRGRSCYGRIN
jgi:hypothetical protein